MTVQEKMKSRLEALNIPKKSIDVYGSQIVVTCQSESASKKWVNLLSQFAKIRHVGESFDDAVVNENTSMRPTKVKVWRVFATV